MKLFCVYYDAYGGQSGLYCSIYACDNIDALMLLIGANIARTINSTSEEALASYRAGNHLIHEYEIKEGELFSIIE